MSSSPDAATWVEGVDYGAEVGSFGEDLDAVDSPGEAGMWSVVGTDSTCSGRGLGRGRGVLGIAASP